MKPVAHIVRTQRPVASLARADQTRAAPLTVDRVDTSRRTSNVTQQLERVTLRGMSFTPIPGSTHELAFPEISVRIGPLTSNNCRSTALRCTRARKF
jgi:hypothetical protein